MAQIRSSLNQVRVILIILLLIIPLLLMGCWNRREVNDLNLVTAIGIDRMLAEGKPRYLVTLHTLNSIQSRRGTDSGGLQFSTATPGGILSMEGDTVYDAIRNFTLRSSRQMFLAHTQVLIIGEETAREGINQILDICLRHRDIRMRTWVVVCEGTAQEALQAHSDIEAELSVEIDKLLTKNQPRTDKTVAADIRKTAHALFTPGLELSVSNMKLFAPPEMSFSTGKETGHGTTPGGNSLVEGSDGQAGEMPPQKKSFALSGAAVFQGDRMVGRFNEEETQGLLFITGQARSGIIPFAFEASDINASFLYLKIKSRLKPVVNEDGSLRFEIDLKGDGELVEQNNAVIDFSRENLKAAEKLINQEVERRCLLAIARAQELNTDLFGFGEKLHQTKPEVWKEVQGQWGEVFPTVSVRVITDMKIAHTGLSDKPILVK